MNRDDLYQLWRGQGHPWVAWFKPSLLGCIPEDKLSVASEGHAYRSETPPWANVDTSWLPAEKTAIFLELPADEALLLALALGQRGVRPVLAINNCSATSELVPMESALALLVAGARFKSAFPPGDSVAPAFLLDSRRGGDRGPIPGCFDNRWALFDSDLPPAQALRAAGIERALVVQRGRALAEDLEAILRAYQAAGLGLFLLDLDEPGAVGALVLAGRGWFGSMFGRLRRRFAFHRRADGSFGRRVPVIEVVGPSHG